MNLLISPRVLGDVVSLNQYMIILTSLFLLSSLFSFTPSTVEGYYTHSIEQPIAISFAGGNGSASNPFQISNITQLQNMSANVSAHYILINDIDASATCGWNGGKGFDPIGAGIGGPFTGLLDGDGYTIFDLYVNQTSLANVGFFGNLVGGTMIDVHLVNCTIIGSSYVGGLAGVCSGQIINSSFNGSVKGTLYVGGICGMNNFMD
jgi:hypothetical protein